SCPLLTAGPKYHLLAHTVLSLAEVQDSFRTHDLAITSNEESSFWLPLYGSMCCRLAAQPNCMAQQMMCGFLKLQQQVGEQQSWARLFCVLRGSNLLCYRRPQDTEALVEPALTIAINKVSGGGRGSRAETRIRATEKDPRNKLQSMSVTNRYGGEEVTHTLLAESRADTQRWMEAFWQHFYDLSQWKQCCDELMKIEVPSPRKPPALLAKQGSLYHEMGKGKRLPGVPVLGMGREGPALGGRLSLTWGLGTGGVGRSPGCRGSTQLLQPQHLPAGGALGGGVGQEPWL
uniref:PH domain-containing protein n=1 Tax=Gopherus evgoodei TaxID=1825980 RepID=A0A8C4YST9_9SAUR